MEVAILYNGMPIYIDQFSNKIYTINGILVGFEIGLKKYYYFTISQYKKPQYVYGQKIESKLKDGYYCEDDFLRHIQPNTNYLNPIPTEQNLIDSSFYSYEKEFKELLAKENDTIVVKTTDYSQHAFIAEEIKITFQITLDSNDKIKYYAKNGILNIPRSPSDAGFLSSEPVLTNNLLNNPSGFFYSKNFGAPQLNWMMIDDDLKVRFDKTTTLISFQQYWIVRKIFPKILNDFTNVDNYGRGNIANTSPLATNLVKALGKIKKSWGYYYNTSSPTTTNFDPIFNILQPNIEEYEKYYESLKNFYSDIYKIQDSIINKSDDEKLEIIGRLLDESSILILPLPTRLALLRTLALKPLLLDSSSVVLSDEEYALKLVNSIDINNQSEVNYFLGWLLDEKFDTGNKLPPYKNNIYSLLYNKIQNYSSLIKMFPELFGDKVFSKDNRTRFVNSIYFLWTESKYNPYKNIDANGNPDYALIDNSTFTYDKSFSHSSIINYKSKKNKLGIYDDIYTFEFDPWANGIYWITDENYALQASSSNHMFQPMTLLYYPSETDISIQIPSIGNQYNGAIPLFYLAYIDKDGDTKDFNTKVGLLFDVVTTISGIGNLAKLRHLRYLSKLGQVLVVIEAIQISAGIMSFLLNFVENCNDNSFCKKLKTVLFFVEITSLVTDPIAAAKAKKAAREVVEEGIENGWPSGMLNEIDGHTPREKLEELADLDIVEYLAKYREKAKKALIDKLNKDRKYFENVYSNNPLIIPPGDEIGELITIASGKGLSTDDIAGIIHQASRKDRPKASIAELTTRMDNLIIVRRRGYPFPFTSKIEFDNYINEKIIPTLDKFGLPKDNVYVGGSGVTSQNSLSGGIQDTDWVVYFSSKREEQEFVNKLVDRFTQMTKTDPKILKNKEAKKYIEGLLENYADTGQIHKQYIVAIEDGKKINLFNDPNKTQNYIVDFFGTTKTDITPKVFGDNNNIPQVKINIE